MEKQGTCKFNADAGCVELRRSDGSMLAIDCTAVENSIETTMNLRSEMDRLIFNAPLEWC